MSPSCGPVEDTLLNCLYAIAPYGADAVLIGGMIPYIYRQLDWTGTPRHSFLFTRDIDWVVPRHLPVREQMLRERLESQGFALIQDRDTRPPVQRFVLADSQCSTAFVEFLTPLTGPARARDGSPRSPVEVQSRLNAQALRYLDLLLIEPLEVDPVSVFGADPARTGPLRVPNPAAYAVQKALTSERRGDASKRNKDLHDIYDIAVLTRGRWSELAQWTRALRDGRPGGWLERASKLLDNDFAATGDGGDIVATMVASHSPAAAPTADGVRRVVTRFAAHLFDL